MKVMGTNDNSKRAKGGGRMEEPASGLLKRSPSGGISEGSPNKNGQCYLWVGESGRRRCVSLCV